MLLFYGLLLRLIGLIMLMNPKVFWAVFEKRKFEDADKASNLYIWSTRFGDMMYIAIA